LLLVIMLLLLLLLIMLLLLLLLLLLLPCARLLSGRADQACTDSTYTMLSTTFRIFASEIGPFS